MARAKLTAAQMKIAGLHLYAALAAAATLLLVVTGADAASRETEPAGGHRTVAAVVCFIIIGLVAWLMLVEKRSWLRGLGWIALVGVAAECGLGVWAAPASPMTCMAHAFLAPLLLSVVVAIVVGTSGSWRRDPVSLQDQGWPPLRGVARNTLFVVVIQVALGAAFRYGSINVMTHILGALVVTIFILTLVVLVTLMPEHPTLRPAAITLGVVTFVQIFLGLTVVSMGSAHASQPLMAACAVAHVTTGAVVLATTLVVALETWRNVRSASESAEAGNDQGLIS
jgi:heme A synthase